MPNLEELIEFAKEQGFEVIHDKILLPLGKITDHEFGVLIEVHKGDNIKPYVMDSEGNLKQTETSINCYTHELVVKAVEVGDKAYVVDKRGQGHASGLDKLRGLILAFKHKNLGTINLNILNSVYKGVLGLLPEEITGEMIASKVFELEEMLEEVHEYDLPESNKIIKNIIQEFETYLEISKHTKMNLPKIEIPAILNHYSSTEDGIKKSIKYARIFGSGYEGIRDKIVNKILTLEQRLEKANIGGDHVLKEFKSYMNASKKLKNLIELPRLEVPAILDYMLNREQDVRLALKYAEECKFGFDIISEYMANKIAMIERDIAREYVDKNQIDLHLNYIKNYLGILEDFDQLKLRTLAIPAILTNMFLNEDIKDAINLGDRVGYFPKEHSSIIEDLCHKLIRKGKIKYARSVSEKLDIEIKFKPKDVQEVYHEFIENSKFKEVELLEDWNSINPKWDEKRIKALQQKLVEEENFAEAATVKNFTKIKFELEPEYVQERYHKFIETGEYKRIKTLENWSDIAPEWDEKKIQTICKRQIETLDSFTTREIAEALDVIKEVAKITQTTPNLENLVNAEKICINLMKARDFELAETILDYSGRDKSELEKYFAEWTSKLIQNNHIDFAVSLFREAYEYVQPPNELVQECFDYYFKRLEFKEAVGLKKAVDAGPDMETIKDAYQFYVENGYVDRGVKKLKAHFPKEYAEIIKTIETDASKRNIEDELKGEIGASRRSRIYRYFPNVNF